MNMAVQMNYGEPKAGMPGGLVDRSNYSAVTLPCPPLVQPLPSSRA